MDVWNNNTAVQPQMIGQASVDEDISDAVQPAFAEGDEIIDAGEDFNFDDFQVVRREFFAHMREPAVTLNKCKFYVNSACIKRFPETDYVQVMINRERKIMALRPCSEGTKDSFPWCSINSKGKRQPKQTSCKIFFAKVIQMMGWDPDYRYKLLGRLIKANGQYLIAFDLTATEVYQRTEIDGEKPKVSRTPVFPAGWQDQFGLPYKEHQQSLQVDTFDGYAVYSIKEAAKSVDKADDSEPAVDTESPEIAYAPTMEV